MTYVKVPMSFFARLFSFESKPLERYGSLGYRKDLHNPDDGLGLILSRKHWVGPTKPLGNGMFNLRTHGAHLSPVIDLLEEYLHVANPGPLLKLERTLCLSTSYPPFQAVGW